MSPLQAYKNLQQFRRQRARSLRFLQGQQWDEHIGNTTEADAFIQLGHNPSTLNLIRRTVSLLVGRFRKNSADLYAELDPQVVALNNLPELDARLFEEFIISGCAAQRISCERRPQGSTDWVDNINPDHLIVSKFLDPRGIDIDLIGMIHFFNLSQLSNRFGSDRKNSAAKMRRIFNECSSRLASEKPIFPFGPSDFLNQIPTPPEGKIPVIEHWAFLPDNINSSPCSMQWHQSFTAIPTNETLYSAVADKPLHPFVLKLYPFADGQVRPYVADLIDRQRHINRLLTIFESTIACSAKGVLIYPSDQLTENLSFKKIADLWARPGAVIPIAHADLHHPQQLHPNVANMGIEPIIRLQLQLFDEAAGISPAIRGENLSASISDRARQQILENADNAIADLIESFRSFIIDRNSRLTPKPIAPGDR